MPCLTFTLVAAGWSKRLCFLTEHFSLNLMENIMKSRKDVKENLLRLLCNHAAEGVVNMALL